MYCRHDTILVSPALRPPSPSLVYDRVPLLPHPYGIPTHVVVLPAELGGEVSTGRERLASLDNVQVLDVKFEVLGCVATIQYAR
jgi:hypothetical protein